jgi:catechol 2,3-dioxygenase-like lactoylglutathione lyase family enzyme
MTETISKPPFSLVGIDHVVLLVTDLDRAMRFYGEVLGCQPGYSYPKIGMEQVWCGNSLIVLQDYRRPGGEWAIPPVEGGRNVDHVCIALSPFDHDAFRAHLAAHGVEIVEEAFHGGARGQGHSFYVLDPFGNKLELKGPPVYPDGRAQLE